MKKHIKQAILPGILCAALLLSGCGGSQKADPSGAAEDSAEVNSTPPTVAVSNIDVDSLFSDRDMEQGYDASDAVTVLLTGDTAVCSSDAVKINGGRITLLDDGVYLVSGTLTDGQIIVNADSSDKVQIVLDGAGITSASSAAIYCMEADKVFVTIAEGSENTLANGGTFTAIDDNNIDAVIFSKTDLTLNGTGSLSVTSPAGHGIVSKDELTMTGGTYTVTAAKHGLTGKNSVAVADGSFTITSSKDGIHAENADDISGGFLYIADGSFTIDAQGDAISAGSDLQIDGGSYALTAGGGSDSAAMKNGDTMQRPGGFQKFSDGGMPPDSKEPVSADAAGDTESCKGIKADGSMAINGGTFTLDTADDGGHSGGDVTIAAGEWTIRTGDDGIHAESAVTIRGGSFSIPYCYEGVEGQSVTIDNGTIDITAYDDGINAAGGADNSGVDFGFGKQDQFAADEKCFVIINGGTITIVSDGDSIDSNGSLTVNGGTLDLTCNGNGNTAIDVNGTYTNNGGEITTNDGSESGTGGMGGVKPRGSGKENGGGDRPPQQPFQAS